MTPSAENLTIPPLSVIIDSRMAETVEDEQLIAQQYDKLRQSCAMYLSDEELLHLDKGFEFAAIAHRTQRRTDGDPYICHPIAVAAICANWRLDLNSLMSALLHDTIEDQDVSKEDIQSRFGREVADIVDGLTKLERIHFNSKLEQQAESFRKMLLAMSRDIRVILVKLADRLHNMRTLGVCAADKRHRIARETLEVYVPIADRLGLNIVVRTLQDLCFQAMYPKRYEILKKARINAASRRKDSVNSLAKFIENTMAEYGLQGQVIYHYQSLWAIFHKMRTKRKTFDNVVGLYNFRVIVEKFTDCYTTIGVLHKLYQPVPGRFKDYIAIPRLNGYQALHTTVVTEDGWPINFQVRTVEMDHIAEDGIASHWKHATDGTNITLQNVKQSTQSWLQSLLDIQSSTADSHEFLSHIKVELTPDEVYVLTPQGRIVSLPAGACPIDLAYMIHTDVGMHAEAALINGEYAPLSTPLHSGDRVEVITAPDAEPSIEWLKMVRTGKARSEIRSYLKRVNQDQAEQFGKKLLMQAMEELHMPYPSINDPAWERILKIFGNATVGELLTDVGTLRRSAHSVVQHFNTLNQSAESVSAEPSLVVDEEIYIKGNEGQSITLAPCCCPLPGEPILGHVRRGSGIMVHCADCEQIQSHRQRTPKDWIPVFWDPNPVGPFIARIEVVIHNEEGVIGLLTTAIGERKINIIGFEMQEQATSAAVVHLTLQLKNREQLDELFKTLRNLPQFGKVSRYKEGSNHNTSSAETAPTALN